MEKVDPTIFKAYDIRGVYPSQINEDTAYKIAQAYAKFIGPKTVVLGRDVRLSGPKLFEAAKQGLVDHGVNVIDIGVITTDMMYFAVVHLNADGGLAVTASHNPKEFNGFKMVRAKAAPISGDTGIMDIRDLAAQGYNFKSEILGQVSTVDILQDYIKKIVSVVDVAKIKKFKIVANANFGAIGKNLKALAEKLPMEIVWINEQPDGSFPKGRPDPLIPENRTETSEIIKSSGADFGVAWDADADRCFFFDETGRFLSGYFTTAILAELFLKRYGPSKVLVDSKLNWATMDVVKKYGGEALMTRTGHSFYKAKMIELGAVFGGEVSAHYYFKDFYFLDNGLMPFVFMLQLLSETGKKMSGIYQPLFEKYFIIDETNFTVRNVDEAVKAAKEKFSGGKLSEIDGVAMEFVDWRYSVRGSNTEPIIRLNMEAKSAEVLAEKQKEMVEFIKRFV